MLQFRPIEISGKAKIWKKGNENGKRTKNWKSDKRKFERKRKLLRHLLAYMKFSWFFRLGRYFQKSSNRWASEEGVGSCCAKEYRTCLFWSYILLVAQTISIQDVSRQYWFIWVQGIVCLIVFASRRFYSWRIVRRDYSISESEKHTEYTHRVWFSVDNYCRECWPQSKIKSF